MLEVCNVDTRYGKAQALWDVCLEINQAEIVALVGSNGAGKTTLVNTITGLLRPSSGSIVFQGKRIDGLPSHAIVGRGISHVPQGGRVFPDMNVRENLEMGSYPIHAWKQRAETFEQVYQLFPMLKERQNQQAGTLSGGERQMLAIARALMAKPKLLLLDEPSFGLAPILVQQMFEMIAEINRQGVTVLLVEQNVRAALELAQRAYVIENGRIVGEGKGDDLLSFESIRSAYLA